MTMSLIRLMIASAVAVLATGVGGARVAAAQPSGYERIRCESRDGREAFCRASIDGDVTIRRNLSNTRCYEGQNWRWTRDGIYVRDGCRAEFEYRRRGGWGGSGGSGGWGGGGSWGGGWGGNRDVVTCQSQGKGEAFCPAPIQGNVDMIRQLSDAPCIYGRSWRWTENGITVWDGCRAEFAYRRRGGELPPDGPRFSRVTCQSEGGREEFCPAPIAGEVRVARNISDTRCREGRNWSWTTEGVRVWGGCRADFEYRSRR